MQREAAFTLGSDPGLRWVGTSRCNLAPVSHLDSVKMPWHVSWVQDWDVKADWMRKVGATAASFDVSGSLLTLQLGPKPHDPSTQQDDYREPEPDAARSPVAGLIRAERRR